MNKLIKILTDRLNNLSNLLLKSSKDLRELQSKGRSKVSFKDKIYQIYNFIRKLIMTIVIGKFLFNFLRYFLIT